jgi:protein-tyrosine phosphatase
MSLRTDPARAIRFQDFIALRRGTGIWGRSFGEEGVSLKYSLTFLVLSLSCVVLTIAAWNLVGWPGIVALYAGFSFFLLAVAYAGAGPKLLLKRASGRRSLLAWVLFGPYFLLNDLTFALYRLVSREPPYVQVAPNVFFGRRLSFRESEGPQWVTVLDLAGEFAESRRLRQLEGYRSLPVLDATAPTETQLQMAVAWVTAGAASGPVYIHCALGHGRSACVVIAYLLSVRIVRTVGEGTRLLRSLRPGVRLHPAQRNRLRVFESRSQGTQAPALHLDRFNFNPGVSRE